MKCLLALLVLFVAVALAEEELVQADACDEETCQLPDCRCSSSNTPGGLNPRDVPQFVMVTFDDGVNIMNIQTYRQMVYNRANPNGCPAGVTFFVNHQYTNYQLVNCTTKGLKLHCIQSAIRPLKLTGQKQIMYDDMKKEFGDQKIQMSHFDNIPYDEIKGVRIPFL